MSRWLPFASALAFLPAALPAQVRSPTPPADRWAWTITPSVFAPSQSGSVALTEFNFVGTMTNPSAGGALYVRGDHGDWSFVLDGYYLGMNQPYAYNYSNPGGGGVDSGATNGHQWALQLLGLRRISRAIQVSFGVAANGVQATGVAYGTGFIGAPGPYTVTTSETTHWALPVAGARWMPLEVNRWRLALFGEVGYWGGDNKMWQLVPSLTYQIGPLIEVGAQYRWLYTMYRPSSDPSAFEYDVHSYGPELAVGLHFSRDITHRAPRR